MVLVRSLSFRHRLLVFIIFLLFLVGLVFYLNFSLKEDVPWWGLIDNPATHNKNGALWQTINTEYSYTNSKFIKFYQSKKRLPNSFKEADDFYKSSLINPIGESSTMEKIGYTAATPISSDGYNSSSYKVHYADKTYCQFHLTRIGYEMQCSRRDYWKNGQIVEEMKFTSNIVHF